MEESELYPVRVKSEETETEITRPDLAENVVGAAPVKTLQSSAASNDHH